MMARRGAGAGTAVSFFRSLRVSISATRMSPGCYLRVPDGPGPAGLGEDGAGLQAERDSGGVPGHRPRALRAHLVGGERGKRLKVGQPGGAPAQFLPDRGALLPPVGGFQAGAQRGQLPAQAPASALTLAANSTRNSARRSRGRRPCSSVTLSGSPASGASSLIRPPRVVGGPFRLEPRLLPQIRGAGRGSGAGGFPFQVFEGLGQRDLLLDQRQTRPGTPRIVAGRRACGVFPRRCARSPGGRRPVPPTRPS